MTRGEERQLLLLNAVWQELAAIKSRGGAQHLLPLLIGQDSANQGEVVVPDTTEMLLLIKKWTEFFARYKVVMYLR